MIAASLVDAPNLLPTLDTASGYNACGVAACFDVLHALDLATWLHCAERGPERCREDLLLARALARAHPWAVWRARDQLCAELCRFESAEGRALLHDAATRERLEHVTERLVLSIVAEPWLDEPTVAALRDPLRAVLPPRLATRGTSLVPPPNGRLP